MGKLKLNRVLPLLLVMFMAVGCAGLFQGVVTVTTVVDSAMKSWATLSVDGMTTAQLDAQVKAAHLKYRQAAAVCQDALVAYKTSGNQQDYIKALEAAKVAATGVLDIITPLLSFSKGEGLYHKLGRATTI